MSPTPFRRYASTGTMLLAMCTGIAAGAFSRSNVSTAPRSTASDSVEARAAAVRFLAAFDSLQWEPFCGALTSDVTVFMPGAGPLARLEGRAAVEAEFTRFFADVRARAKAAGRDGPPYLDIGARINDVRVQPLAPGAVIVSFHLRSGQAPPSRRTAVFRREPDGVWRLVHLHASNPPSAS